MQGVSNKPLTEIKSLNDVKGDEKSVVKENTDRTRFLNELGVMQYYSTNGVHPNIHTCSSFNIDTQTIISKRLDQLKLNYREKKLSVFLRDGRTVSPTEGQQYHIFSQLLGALTHLNERGMKHGDVKLGNTVIDWGERTCSGLLQLIDFETTTLLGKNIGPPTFSPPKKSDINPDLWAFFHEMAVLLFKCDRQKANSEKSSIDFLNKLNEHLSKVEIDQSQTEKETLLKLIKDILVMQKTLTFNDVNACFDQIMKTIKQPLFEGRPITGLEEMYKENINKLIKKKKDFKDPKFTLKEMFQNANQAKTYLNRYKKQLEEYSFIQEFSSLSQLCMTEIDNQIKCLDDIIASCRSVHEKKTGKECCTASVAHLEDFFKEIEPVRKNIIHIPSEKTLFDVNELHKSKHLFFQKLNLKKQEIKLGEFSEFFSQLEKEDFVKAYEALKHIAGSEEKKDLRLKLLGIMKKKLESNKEKLADYLSKTKSQKISDFSQISVRDITVSLKEIQINSIGHVISLIDSDGKPTNNTDGKKLETLEEALKKMQLDVPVVKDLPPPPTFRKGPNEQQLPFDSSLFP